MQRWWFRSGVFDSFSMDCVWVFSSLGKKNKIFKISKEILKGPSIKCWDMTKKNKFSFCSPIILLFQIYCLLRSKKYYNVCFLNCYFVKFGLVKKLPKYILNRHQYFFIKNVWDPRRLYQISIPNDVAYSTLTLFFYNSNDMDYFLFWEK